MALDNVHGESLQSLCSSRGSCAPFPQFWQLYNSITLFNMFQLPQCKEWQVGSAKSAARVLRLVNQPMIFQSGPNNDQFNFNLIENI